MENELIWSERRHCKFFAVVDGVISHLSESYAFSRLEIISQLSEIYTAGAKITVTNVQWSID